MKTRVAGAPARFNASASTDNTAISA
jgi:hypothetical protein